jgi:hypothetical protein
MAQVEGSYWREQTRMRLLFPELGYDEQRLLTSLALARDEAINAVNLLKDCADPVKRKKLEKNVIICGVSYFTVKDKVLERGPNWQLTPFQENLLEKELFHIPLPDYGIRKVKFHRGTKGVKAVVLKEERHPDLDSHVTGDKASARMLRN